MQTGGDILGEGTYGCVFHPPIKCDGEKRRRSGVGKVVRKLFDANEEMKIGKLLAKIDPKGIFTNPLTSTCIIKKKNITKTDQNNLICGITSTLNENTSYKQLIYKYKGVDLSLTEKGDIRKMYNLIEGLKTLQTNKLCHRDIKEENILDLGKKYVYIDFGLSCKLDEVDRMDDENILMHNYIYYPPEFKMYAIMQTLLTKFDYTNDKESLVDDVFDELQELSFVNTYQSIKSDLKSLGVYKTIRGDVYNAIHKVVHDTVDMSVVNRKKYFTKLAKYADVFSLGVVILRESLKEMNDSYSSIDSKQQQKLEAIIKRAIHFDVFQRCSAEELLVSFKEFLGMKKIPQNCTKHFSLTTLKALAKKYNMKTSGTKQELYDRLSKNLKI